MKPAIIVTTPDELREIIRQELRAAAPPAEPEREILSREQVAELLGVHPMTVPKLVRDKGLPVAGRIGKLWRFRRSHVLQWLEHRNAMKKAGPDPE